jgi:Tfp pilus assembly protein PilX
MAEGAGARCGVDAAEGAAVAAEMAQNAAEAAIRMVERPVNSTLTVPQKLEKTR